jgi:hypothetical protein
VCGVISAVSSRGAGVHTGLPWLLCGRLEMTAYLLPAADVMWRDWGWNVLVSSWNVR